MMANTTLLFALLLTVSVVFGKKQCNTPADIAFVIDSSRSIYGPDFETQIRFVQELLKEFNIGPGPDDVHVSALTFGHEVAIKYTFNDVKTAKDALAKTGEIEHALGDYTYTHNALEVMRTELFSPENGARSGVAKICIVMTDGASSYKEKTLEQAELAKADNIKIFAIGIGKGADKKELLAIASPPAEDNYFHADSFDELKDDLKKIGYKTCEAIKTQPAPPVEPADQPAKTCQGKNADVVFVIDSSSSIWPVDFKTQLKFLADVTSNFDVDSGKTRVGMLTFSNESMVEFYMDEYQTKEDIKKAIEAVKTEGGLTNTHLALQTVRDEMYSKEHGSRRDVAHICIVITDGESREQDATKDEAKLIHETGVDVFAIGVGKDANKKELGYIASKPEYVFTVNGYDALKKIENILAVKTCKAGNPGELKDAETEKICRGKIQDILFVVDMSNSIWPVHFSEQLDFLSKLVGFFDIDRGNTRVGMLTFSDDAEVQFYLDDYDKKEYIQEAILEVKQKGGLTFTNLALLRVLEEMMDKAHGSRPDVDHTVIVITDGISTKPDKTKLVAEALHDVGVEVIAIGVGDNVDADELKAIASKPEFVFKVGGYDTLEQIKNMLARTTCEGFRPKELCEAEGMGDTTAFTAFVGAEVEVETGDILIFDKVLYNINSGYDPSTGIFTAQAYGIYRFAFSTDIFWQSSALNVNLMKNNVQIVAPMYTSVGNEVMQSKDVAVMELEAGDRVWVQVDSGEDGDGLVIEIASTFSGVFLSK